MDKIITIQDLQELYCDKGQDEDVCKQCGRCKNYKPYTEFRKNAQTKDGYSFYCKDCKAYFHKKYRDTIVERECDICAYTWKGKKNQRCPECKKIKHLSVFLTNFKKMCTWNEPKTKRKPTHNQSCSYCNKQFMSINKNTQYCTQTCRYKDKYWNKGIKEKQAKERGTEYIDKPCIICGEIMYKTKVSHKQKACSTKCRLEWSKQRKHKRKGIKYIDRHCVVCGEVFKTPNRRTNKTCGNESCKEVYRKATAIENKHKRRALIEGGDDYSHYIALVKANNVFKCYWCADTYKINKLHIDHIKPLSKGGTDTWDNICLACSHCNLSKGAKDIQEWNYKRATTYPLLGSSRLNA